MTTTWVTIVIATSLRKKTEKQKRDIILGLLSNQVGTPQCQIKYKGPYVMLTQVGGPLYQIN